MVTKGEEQVILLPTQVDQLKREIFKGKSNIESIEFVMEIRKNQIKELEKEEIIYGINMENRGI